MYYNYYSSTPFIQGFYELKIYKYKFFFNKKQCVHDRLLNNIYFWSINICMSKEQLSNETAKLIY